MNSFAQYLIVSCMNLFIRPCLVSLIATHTVSRIVRVTSSYNSLNASLIKLISLIVLSQSSRSDWTVSLIFNTFNSKCISSPRLLFVWIHRLWLVIARRIYCGGIIELYVVSCISKCCSSYFIRYESAQITFWIKSNTHCVSVCMCAVHQFVNQTEQFVISFLSSPFQWHDSFWQFITVYDTKSTFIHHDNARTTVVSNIHNTIQYNTILYNQCVHIKRTHIFIHILSIVSMALRLERHDRFVRMVEFSKMFTRFSHCIYKWYMTCQFLCTLSLVQSYASSDMVLSFFCCCCHLLLSLSFYLLLLMFSFFSSTIFSSAVRRTHLEPFSIFSFDCVYLRNFLENENHISIIQRLATETHSYSGRSRLTPVNPKNGNECSLRVWEQSGEECGVKNMSN